MGVRGAKSEERGRERERERERKRKRERERKRKRERCGGGRRGRRWRRGGSGSYMWCASSLTRLLCTGRRYDRIT